MCHHPSSLDTANQTSVGGGQQPEPVGTNRILCPGNLELKLRGQAAQTALKLELRGPGAIGITKTTTGQSCA